MTHALPLLDVSNLACARGGKRLFSGLTFQLRPGDYVELRGANGAGKSSFLRVLAGLLDPAEGHFAFRDAFHFVGHLDGVKAALSVRENLLFWADLQGGGDVAAALQAFSLLPLADEQAGLLSQGQKRRLALSRLALSRRSVWLLDEPTVGLDAASLDQLRGLIATQLQAGGAVLAATHVELGLVPRDTLVIGGR